MRLLSRNPWCWAGCRQALPVLLGCWLFLFSISAPVGFAVEGQTPPATEITRPVVVNDVPPRPEGLNIYVNDYAGLLTPEDKKRLKERLQALDESGIAQVSVLILPDTDRDLSEFAPVIMNRWDIQHYKKKDGLLVLVNAHRVKNNLPGNRIFVGTGYALESMLPDA
ncbi:MAG TPA: TPM domain-containing protein, partial [Oculatellaceae cyanobacterium]